MTKNTTLDQKKENPDANFFNQNYDWKNTQHREVPEDDYPLN